MSTNGTALRTIRQLKGISQGELGRRIGKPHHYLSNVEAGRRGVSRKVAEQIATVLDVPLETIWWTNA